MHLGGKIEVQNKVPVKTRDDLSMAYTPGRRAGLPGDRRRPRQGPGAHDQAERGRRRDRRDGRARPRRHRAAGGDAGDGGQGDALQGVRRRSTPGRSAWTRTDTDEIIAIVKAIAPGFGGINLEDIAAPRCFEIEGRLRRELDIPVFHDDQHGTAVVVLAGAPERGRSSCRSGSTSCASCWSASARPASPSSKLLMEAGVRDIIGCDREGALYPGSEGADGDQEVVRARTRTRAGSRARADEALAGADVFLGLSGPGAVLGRGGARDGATTRSSSRWRTPMPEMLPEEVMGDVRVIATGRSDYPNQINNVLAFPGIFRGALDRAGDRHQRPDEAGRGAGDRRRHRRGRAVRGVHHPERLQQGRRRGRRARRRTRRPSRPASRSARPARRRIRRRSTGRRPRTGRLEATPSAPLWERPARSCRARRRRR